MRNPDRLDAVREFLDHGARVVVGDLADLRQARDVAEQANALGRMDAVIHNAGVYSGPAVLPVNVVAPYVLTACMHRPDRLVYLSSGMHRGGRAHPRDDVDWTGASPPASYSDSKLFVTTLAVAVGAALARRAQQRRRPRLGAHQDGRRPCAPDDLHLGHLTQEWLATSDDPAAAPPAATGTTNTARNRTRPSTTSGSRTRCSAPSPGSPARRSLRESKREQREMVIIRGVVMYGPGDVRVAGCVEVPGRPA